jgi:hypothetical protein
MLSALAKRHLKILAGTCNIADFRDWWADRQDRLLGVAASLMLVAALVWLTYQFWRLLWQSGVWGAIDLRILHGLVQDWFAGRPIYSAVRDAIHPPATYALLWPLLGWLEVAPARWLWALTTLAALGWLGCLAVRESGAETRQERAVAALMVISAYPTGAAIGNGQLIIHILPVLLTGLLLLRRYEADWRRDALAGILFLITLVKPSISAPFFWIVLFRANSLRPAWVVMIGYVALTSFAIGFHGGDLVSLLGDWHARSSAVAITPGDGNVSNLHIWLSTLGMQQWILPASLLVLAALGAWIYRYRHVELWLLVGVTAYVARFWTYHRWYDDLLILLPMIALFRLAKRAPTYRGADVLAGTLLALTILAMLAPGGLFLFPPPWNMRYVAVQVVIWLMGLIFLAEQARFEKQSAMV